MEAVLEAGSLRLPPTGCHAMALAARSRIRRACAQLSSHWVTSCTFGRTLLGLLERHPPAAARLNMLLHNLAHRCIWNGDAMGAAALGVNLQLVSSWTLVGALIRILFICVDSSPACMRGALPSPAK